ncbi:low affinity iron permease family protein [Candidatus Nitrospira nitrificans]|nr:low affinity iron permease family protein [Candidatus Nitrospira nitrificans]
MENSPPLGKHTNVFNRLANHCARLLGTARAFGIAMMIVAAWAITGPIFHFSDTWQLVINTGTTIVTFLMVFLIQNTQNRDSAAIQLKLDEVIRSTRGAHNAMLDLEKLSQQDLDNIQSLYQQLADQARQGAARGEAATGTPIIHAAALMECLEEKLEEKRETNGSMSRPPRKPKSTTLRK